MYIYQNNAFRVLGLLPSASMQEILSRVNEIKVKKSLSFDVVYDYDFPWMGVLDRSDENVINALQRLEDPVTRLKEEIFWFWIEGDEDQKALNYLIQNKRQSAHEIWKNVQELTSIEKPTPEVIRAYHNQAILAHSSVISREFDIKYQEDFEEQKIIVQEESEVLWCPQCQKVYEKEWKVCLKCGVNLVLHKNERKEHIVKSRKSDETLNEAHWKNWKFAYSKFLILNSSEIFWTIISKKIEIINDPRLPGSKTQELKKTFLLDVIDPNVEFISRALTSKDYERTKLHANLLNGLSLPSSILKDGFNRALGHHIDSLNQYSNDAQKKIYQWEDTVAKDIVLGVYSTFSGQIKNIIYEGNLIDINCISDFAVARDNCAGVLRRLSVDMHNKLHDFEKSYEVINEAIECAASGYLKQRFHKDAEAVRLALLSSGQKKEKIPNSINWMGKLKSIPWWGWLIGICVISSFFSDDKSTKTNSTYNRSSSYQNSSRSELAALKTRIDNLKESVEEKIPRLEEVAKEIKSKEDEMTALKQEIDNIERQYKNNPYYYDHEIPSDVMEEYDSKIDNYNNNLLPVYTDLVNQGKKLYDEYEQEVQTHDALVESYNKKVQ